MKKFIIPVILFTIFLTLLESARNDGNVHLVANALAITIVLVLADWSTSKFNKTKK